VHVSGELPASNVLWNVYGSTTPKVAASISITGGSSLVGQITSFTGVFTASGKSSITGGVVANSVQFSGGSFNTAPRVRYVCDHSCPPPVMHKNYAGFQYGNLALGQQATIVCASGCSASPNTITCGSTPMSYTGTWSAYPTCSGHCTAVGGYASVAEDNNGNPTAATNNNDLGLTGSLLGVTIAVVATVTMAGVSIGVVVVVRNRNRRARRANTKVHPAPESDIPLTVVSTSQLTVVQEFLEAPSKMMA